MNEHYSFIFSIVVALNDKEILAQALVFMIGGYETTSVLLSFFFYVMATEPEVQEKVYQEIRQEIGDVCHHHDTKHMHVERTACLGWSHYGEAQSTALLGYGN